MHLKSIALATAFTLPSAGFAASVDLTGWQENGYQGNLGAGNWIVAVDGSYTEQFVNDDPTVFFDPSGNAQGTQISGTVEVRTATDDDFIGFVIGYEDGEFNSQAADFYLIDWKQSQQSGARAGMYLSHVSGDLRNGPSNPFDNGFWDHFSGAVTPLALANTKGSVGWADNRAYDFEIEFTSTLIRMNVDGVEEFSFAGNFSDGGFGFYTYSQSNVRFSGISLDTAPSAVPLPAAGWLLLGALAGFVAVGRRPRRAT
ncbi:MAG: VPLPA-CTERM sorting domain-containing protein [Pseudomonadota bacterium]